jgi:hypothetical protein
VLQHKTTLACEAAGALAWRSIGENIHAIPSHVLGLCTAVGSGCISSSTACRGGTNSRYLSCMHLLLRRCHRTIILNDRHACKHVICRNICAPSQTQCMWVCLQGVALFCVHKAMIGLICMPRMSHRDFPIPGNTRGNLEFREAGWQECHIHSRGLDQLGVVTINCSNVLMVRELAQPIAPHTGPVLRAARTVAPCPYQQDRVAVCHSGLSPFLPRRRHWMPPAVATLPRCLSR